MLFLINEVLVINECTSFPYWFTHQMKATIHQTIKLNNFLFQNLMSVNEEVSLYQNDEIS